MIWTTEKRSRASPPRCILAAFGAILAAWGAQAPALAGSGQGWKISEVAGEARVLRDGAGWSAARQGDVLVPGSRIETGAAGRMVLVRPGDSIEVASGARFEIATSADGGQRAGILQSLGTLLFRITTRPDSPFKVDTPYLAAVIKGTTFTVTVDETSRRSALHVSQGAVEVTSIGTGQVMMVQPGMTATVDGARGGAMQLLGAQRSDAARPGAASGGGAAGQPVETESAGAGSAAAANAISHAVGNGRVDLSAVTRGLVNDLDRGNRGNAPGLNRAGAGNESGSPGLAGGGPPGLAGGGPPGQGGGGPPGGGPPGQGGGGPPGGGPPGGGPPGLGGGGPPGGGPPGGGPPGQGGGGGPPGRS